jgi:hypothetical protein
MNTVKKLGRPPINERAMTNAERQARYRNKRKQLINGQPAQDKTPTVLGTP